MSKVIKSALELIGNTPLLQADRYAKKAGVTDANLYVKLEYLNPSGSVKDRIALAMIEDQRHPLSACLFHIYTSFICFSTILLYECNTLIGITQMFSVKSVYAYHIPSNIFMYAQTSG